MLKSPEKANEDLFGNELLENVQMPVTEIIKTIKKGNSKYVDEIKSVKNVLKMIASVAQAKIQAMDPRKTSPGLPEAKMNIDCFFYQYVHQSYGMEDLANKYCEIYLLSIETHRRKDLRIELFRKFVGFDMDKLPYSIWEKFSSLLKHTNIPLNSLFSNNLNSLSVDYNKLRFILKDVLFGCSELIITDAFRQLKKVVRHVCENEKLLKNFDPQDYEVMKDF